MRSHILKTLIGKDLKLFIRNRFFGIMAFAGLITFLAVYFLMPPAVDEKLEIGFYGHQFSNTELDFIAEEGIILIEAESVNELEDAVLKGTYNAAMVFEDKSIEMINSGKRGEMKLFFNSVVPDIYRETITVMLSEIANYSAGYNLELNSSNIILGEDMAGRQIAPRDKLIPFFTMVILLFETLALAGFILTELEKGTLRALLISPVRVSEFFLSKGATGIGLAFFQALFFLIVTGSLFQQPLVIIAALFLGSVLVTAVAFLIASAAKSIMSVIPWGIIVIFIFTIPFMLMMLPVSETNVVLAIPSYYLLDTLHSAVNLDGGFADTGINLLILLVFDAGFIMLGITLLKRRVK